MPDSFSVDTRDVERLSVSIGRASSAMIRAATPVLAKGLLNIKTDTRENVTDHPSWKRLSSTVSYDLTGPLDGEVGYEDRGQGELAGIYEFGSAHRDPHPTLIPAVERELPRFERALADAAVAAAEGIL